jgi:carbonic anhydrase
MERNEAFAASGTWRNTPRLPFLPFKGLYLITCIDPRVDPAEFLGLKFAEAIVARTVGGRVTDAVIQDLSYIGYLVETKAPEGPHFEAVVIHHTDCGSRLLEDPELRRGFAKRSGYDERMLAHLPATVPAETVREDVRKILTAPQISSRITVSGFGVRHGNGIARDRGRARAPRLIPAGLVQSIRQPSSLSFNSYSSQEQGISPPLSTLGDHMAPAAPPP